MSFEYFNYLELTEHINRTARANADEYKNYATHLKGLSIRDLLDEVLAFVYLDAKGLVTTDDAIKGQIALSFAGDLGSTEAYMKYVYKKYGRLK